MKRKKLLFAGIILLAMSLLIVPGCKRASFDIAHQQEAPSYDTGRIPTDPAPLKYDVKKTVDLSIQFGEDMPTEGSMHELTIGTTEMLRGDKAWGKLKTIEGNQPAPDGYEYILAKVSITLKAVASSTRWFDEFEFTLTTSDWVAYSADGTRYDYTQAQTPDPQMYLSLNPGDTKEGYIVVIVPKTDATPYVEEVKDNLYFALYTK